MEIHDFHKESRLPRDDGARGRVRVLGTGVTTVDDPRRRHLRNFQRVLQNPFGSLDPRQAAVTRVGVEREMALA